jgi:protein SCO1/2
MRSRTLGLFFCFVAACGCTKRSAQDVPVLGELPDFALLDQDSQTFDRKAMTGGIWVADFVFTHCASSCPRLTAHMQGLQARLSDAPGVHFLSVTVDPRNDTPEVIKAYMTKNELDESNWRFVTGTEEAVRRLVVEGFKVGMDDEPGEAAGAEEIMHSNYFALVDRQARLRGYYRANNAGIADLERDLRALAFAPPAED